MRRGLGRDYSRRLVRHTNGAIDSAPLPIPAVIQSHALLRWRPSLKHLLTRFRAVLRRSTALVSAATALLIAAIAPAAAQVVPDGNTATSVVISGAVTDVSTGTISQNYGINSFSQFNVGAGSTVNIYAPTGTAGTVNIVNGSQSQILGNVNGFRNGSLGGELYIANPNGFVVGPNGVISAGGVHLSTPQQGFADGMFSGGGVNAGAVQQVLDGSAQLSGADIDVQGRVRGSSRVVLQAGGDVSISGSIGADDRNAAMAAAVNGGGIRITAGGDINVSGAVRAEGSGSGSGGNVYIYASRNAELAASGIVSVAAQGSGDGGFLEFSARDLITLRGAFDAGSQSGKGGTVYIDPNDVIINGTLGTELSHGGNLIVDALVSITVTDGVTLSSRDVPGGAAKQLANASTGHSGNISLTAPLIAIGDNVNILAHADSGFDAGNITIEGSSISIGSNVNILAHADGSGASGNVRIAATLPTNESLVAYTAVTMDGGRITGGKVTVLAHSVSHFAINYGSAPVIPSVADYAIDLDTEGVPTAVTDTLESIVSSAATAADSVADVARDAIETFYESPVIPGLATAQAYVTLTNTEIEATGEVEITATARAESDLTGPAADLRAAVAATLADAKVVLEGSSITTESAATDSLLIKSDAATDVNVRAQTAAVSFSLTDSLVAVRDSQLSAVNSTVSLWAATDEKQVITARQSDDTEAIATVLSVRAQQAQVLVDAEAGWTNRDSAISGNNIAVVAEANRNFVFTANADGNGDDGATVGAVISVASGATRAVIGGDVTALDVDGVGGHVIIGTQVTYSPYYSIVNVKGGTFASTSETMPPYGMWNQDWLDAVKALGEVVADEGVDTSDPSTNVTGETAYALGLNAEYISDEVQGIIGGSFDGRDLGVVNVETEDLVRIQSEWRLANYFKRTEVVSDAGSGGTGALAYGHWQGTAKSILGDDSIIVTPDIVLWADVTLPTISPYTTGILTSVDNALGGVLPGLPVGRPLEAGDLMPDLYSSVHPEDFNITNIVGAGVDGSAVSLDIAVHAFDLTALAEVGDNVALDVRNELQAEATASGGILSRSVDPDAADIQGAGAGAGGAIQVLRMAPNVQVRVGRAVPTPGSPFDAARIGALTLTATNGIVAATYAGARSNVDSIAIAGALSLVDYSGITRANLSGEGSLIIFDAGFASGIEARDLSILAALAGGGAVGADGVGLSAALVFADRDIVADISDFALSAVAKGHLITPGDARIDAKYLSLTALDQSTNIAVAAAGGGVPGQAPDAGGLPDIALGTRSDEYEDELGVQTVDSSVTGDAAGQDAGFSLAADFAGIFVKSRVIAAIEADAEIHTDLATITVDDLSDVFLSAGATLAGSGTAGLGGSVAMATIHSEQIALDRGGSRNDYDGDGFLSLTIAANDLADLRVLAASRAGEHIRNAGVATAIFIDSTSVTSATSVEVTYADPIQLAERATANGLTFAIAGGLAPDVADEAAEDEYDDGVPENDPPGEPSEDTAQPRGISVGISYLRMAVSDTITAGLIDAAIDTTTPPEGTENSTSTIDVDARNLARASAYANSFGASEAFGVAGAAIVIDTDQTTTALIDGALELSRFTGTITLDALNDASTLASIAAQADADTLSFGGSVVVIDDDRATVARLTDAAIARENANADAADESITVDLTAETEGIVQSYQRAGAGDAGDYGIAIMVGVIDADWSTKAIVADSMLDIWDLDLSASETARINNDQDGMATASKGAGAIGSVDTSHNSNVWSRVTSSELTVDSAVDLYAIGETIVTSRAVQSGTGKLNGGAVHSHFRGDGLIESALVDSDVTADFVNLDAYDLSWREITANAATTPDAVGVAGGLTVDHYERDSSARIDGGSVTADDVELFVRSKTRTNNVAVGRAFAGSTTTFGVAAQVVWVIDDRDVIAGISDAAIDVSGDLTVEAERRDVYLMLQATAAESDRSVGIGAGVLLLGGATSALIETPTAFEVTGDVDLLASDYSTAVSIGFGAGVAGTFGGVGSFSYVEMGRRGADANLLADIGDNERGSDERDLSDGVRNEIFQLLRDEGAASAGENATRASTVSAVMSLDGVDAEIGGDLTLNALDSRAVVALTGELQAGGVSGALAYLDKYVRIDSLTTNGFAIGYRNVDLSVQGGRVDLAVDFSKPWNPDEPESEFPPGEEPLPEFPPGEEPLPFPGDEGAGGDDSGDGGGDTGGDAGDGTGSGAVDEFLGETDSGEGAGQRGISFGLAITRVALGGKVDAGIVLSDSATLGIAGLLDVDALSTAETIGIAAGGQTAQANIGASAALVRQTQLVRTRIDGDGELSADTVDLTAQADGSSWSIGALLAMNGGPGFGATLSVNDLDAAVESRVTDAMVTARNAGGIDLDASDTSNAVSLAFAGGRSGAASFNMSVGVNSSRSVVAAEVIGAHLVAATGDIGLHAVRDQSVTGLVIQASIGSGVTIGAALAIADMKGTALALAEDSVLDADDDVIIKADSDSAVASASVGVAASSSVGVSGSMSLSFKSDITRAEIADSTVTAGVSVLVQAQNGGAMDGLGGGDDGALGEMASGQVNVAVGSSAGIGVSLAVLKSESVVEALISGDSVVDASGTGSDAGITGIGRNASNDRVNQAYHGVAVVADNDTTVRGLAITVGLAGTVAVSVQVPIFIIADTALAKIDGRVGHRPDIDSASDIGVFAANHTSLTTFSLVAAASGTASIGADIEYLHLDKLTVASVDRADLDAARDVTVEALSPDHVSTISIAGAFGTQVGLAGVVQVALNESITQAVVSGSSVTADDDLTIRALAPRHTTQVTAAAAGGIVGVGGSVLVYNVRDSIFAGTADSTATNNVPTTSLSVAGDVTILARAEFENDPIVLAGSGGLVAVNAAILVTKFEQQVEATLGDRTAMVDGRANNLSITAEQVFDQTLVLGSVAGSAYAGVGATIGYTSLSNSVLASIGDYAHVDVSGDVSVLARGERNARGGAVAAGGSIAALQGSVVVVAMGRPGEHDETGEHITTVDEDLESANPYSFGSKSFSNGDEDVDSVLDLALAGRSSIDVAEVQAGAPDTILARIGISADVTAGDDISVVAEEAGTINLFSGGASGGIAAVTGGVLVINRGSTVQVALGHHADLVAEAGDIDLLARAAVDTEQATAFAANGGLVSLNAAVANVETVRAMSVLVGHDVTLETLATRTISIGVEEEGETAANTLSIGIGFVTLGGSVATARAGSSLSIDFDDSAGDGATLTGGDIDIAIHRSGNVTATAEGVAGGVVSGLAVKTNAFDTTRATIDLGDITIDNALADTSIGVWNDADLYAESKGVAVGLAAVGAAAAEAEGSAISEVLGSSVAITTGSLSVRAADAESESATRVVEAWSRSTAGGVVGIVAGKSSATNTSTSRIDLNLRDLTVEASAGLSGSASFKTFTTGEVKATSRGISGGLVAGGANSAKAISDSNSDVRLLFVHTASIDNTLAVGAWGSDKAYASTVSGSGGAVVVNGAHSTIEVTPRTSITLLGDTVIAKAIDVMANRAIELNNNSDSTRVSLVGIGGSRMDTTADADMDITLDLDLRANTIDIAAQTEIEKIADGYNGLVGEGGLLTGSSLLSNTDITNDVQIVLSDDARLKQGSNAVSHTQVGEINVGILNVYNVEDRLKIDTGGGILLPSAASRVNIDTTRADIVLLGAEIDSRGAVDLSVTTNAEVDNAAYVNVYGLAGAPYGEAKSTYAGDQNIELRDGSTILSRDGAVSLSAGSAPGHGQVIDLASETRIWNATAFPASQDPVATAHVDQDNRIRIDATSRIDAATDVALAAMGGTVTPYAYGTVSNRFREGLADVVNAFGDLLNQDDVSYDQVVGSTRIRDDNVIDIDGAVIGGAFATRTLHVGANGQITEQIGDLDYEFRDDVNLYADLENYTDDIEDRIADLQAQIDANPSNPPPDYAADLTRWQLELARLEAILLDIGVGGRADMLVIDDVTASGGNVHIDTELLIGSGEIVANGDVLIEVLNQSERVIEVGDITIPITTGGVLSYNGISVEANADIERINASFAVAEALVDPLPNPFPEAEFDITTSGADGAQPRIIIRNDFIQNGSGLSGDLLVTGTISNLSGVVQLATADGDVMVLGGEIAAKTVSISSGGDFFLSAGIGQLLTNIGADPLGLYNEFFTDYADWADGPAHPQDEPIFNLLTGSGQVVAVGSVFIYADYLNINGLIKSGITDWTLVIDDTLAHRLDVADFDGDDPILLHAGLQTSSVAGSLGATEDGDPLGDSIDEIIRNNLSAIRGNVTVRWDPVAQELLVDPIVTQGGYIELVGTVISTGGGRIEAASGYGYVDVDSAADIPIVFSRIDTGPESGVTGEIKIVDLGRAGDGAGSFVVTRYVKEPGGQITRFVSETAPPANDPPILPLIYTGNAATYAIQTPYAITYHIGETEYHAIQTREQRIITSAGTEIFSDLSSTDDVHSVDYVSVDVDAFGENQLANNPYKFDTYQGVSMVLTVAEDWDFIRFDQNTGSTFFERDVTDAFFFLFYDSHRLAANYDIDIGFSGHANADVDIDSVGNIYFDGMFRNQGGATSISSSTGSVLTVGETSLQSALTTIEAVEGNVGRTGVHLVPTGINQPPRTEKFGVSSLPMLIDQLDNRALSVTAEGVVRISELTGDMNIRQVLSTGDADVELYAPGSILVHSSAAASGALVRAGHLTLTAQSGSIGTFATPLRIASDLLTANAAYGISLWSTSRGVTVDRLVSAAGDINLRSASFIRDGNDEQSLDRRAAAGLLEELWDDLGLRDDGNSRDTDAVARLNAQMTADYFRYWQTRGLHEITVANQTVVVAEPYDPDYAFSYAQDERAALLLQGLSTGQISTLELRRTNEFHALHQKFGGSSYNPAYQYSASNAEIAARTRQLYWTSNQLQNTIRESLVIEAADTDYVKETANIVGVNVSLNAGTSIGEQTGTLTIPRNYSPSGADILALRSAEASDIIVTPFNAFVDVYDDLDILASGQLTAFAENNILISSEQAIALRQVAAPLTVRIKSGSGLVAGDRNGIAPHLSAATVVLEGGTGSIGAVGAAITVGGVASLSARATGDVVVSSPITNLGISQVYSANGKAVIGALLGSVEDHNADDAADIIAQEIIVLAGDSIGESGNALDFDVRGLGGRLSLLADEGDVFANIPTGDVTPTGIGSVHGDVNLWLQHGDLILAGTTTPVIAAGGVVTLDVLGKIIGPSTLVPQIAATGGATFNVSGGIGTADHFIITAIAGPTSTGASFNLVDSNLFASDFYIANAGHLSVESLSIRPNGSLTLVNVGDLHLADHAQLTGGAIDIAAIGTGDDIIIDKNLTLTAGTLRLAAAGDLEIAGNGNIDFGGATTLTGNRVIETSPSSALVDMTYDDDLTVISQHGIQIDRILNDGLVTLRTEGIGNVEIQYIRADTLDIDTFLGDVHLIDAVIGALDIDAHGNVDGTYNIRGSADIWSSAGIGIGADDLSTPLVIDSASTATTLHLAGELGVNVNVSGTANLAFTGIETAMVGNGTYVDGAGHVLLDLHDAVPALPPEALRGVGIILTAPHAGINIAGTGIDSNGAPVSISSGNAPVGIRLNADVLADGGDIALTSTLGSIFQAATASIDAGAGRITIDSATDFTLHRLLSSRAGNPTVPTIAVTTGGVLSTSGTGPFIQASSASSFLALDVGSIANVGPLGFTTNVAGLSLSVASGDAHIRNVSDLWLAHASDAAGGNIDLFVQGTLDIDGDVITIGDVVLTATGDITGGFLKLEGDEVYLNALDGSISNGPNSSVLISDLAVRSFQVAAAHDVRLTPIGDFAASHVIAEDGNLSLFATGAVTIGTLGAAGTADLGGSSVAVAQYGSAALVADLPGIANIILPTSYVGVTALAPGVIPVPPVVPPANPVSPVVQEIRRYIGGVEVVPPSLRSGAVIRLLTRVLQNRVTVTVDGVIEDTDDDDEGDGE